VKRLRYLVRINKDPDSDWGASVPDLPGCVATGKTIDSTLQRIQVAIQLHLRGMRADGVVLRAHAGELWCRAGHRDRSTFTQPWRLLPEKGGHGCRESAEQAHTADSAQGAPRLIRSVRRTGRRLGCEKRVRLLRRRSGPSPSALA